MLKTILRHKSGGPAVIILFIFILGGLLAPWLAPNDPLQTDLSQKFSQISFEYPLGTDQLGRCILSRLIYGIRPTLFYAFIIMLGTMGLGTIFGLMAGYFSQIVDEIIMRVVDLLLSFPSQVMIFAIVAIIGTQIEQVVLATIIIKWAWYARVIRCSVLSHRNSNYVLFSKIIGSHPLYILRRHIMPNIAAELVVLATLDLGWAILNLSTLSFLGLGIQPPIPEWGAMMNEAKQVMQHNPIQMIVPGLAIITVVSSFNLLGDAISELFNPKEIVYE